VYNYVKPRQRRGVFASKGDRQVKTAPIVARAKKPNDAGVRLLTIGTFSAKRRMFGSLRMKPGPRCMHFHRLPDDAPPDQLASFEAQDAAYFQQFEAEKLIIDREGAHFIQVSARNESIDLEVGCLAALYAQGPAIYEHLDHWAEQVRLSAGQAAPSRAGTGPAGHGRRVISSGAY
jgi:phage terminase large subunit GpA-like protein